MIHVIATIDLQEGTREAFLSEFHGIVPEVKAEDGCIEYGAAIDLETGIERQAPLRQDTVAIVEKWRDVDALKAHLTAPHMTAYRERIKDFVKGATLQVMAPA